MRVQASVNEVQLNLGLFTQKQFPLNAIGQTLKESCEQKDCNLIGLINKLLAYKNFN